MGLDNVPCSRPCKVLGYAVLTQDGRIDCERTPCPFKGVKHIIGFLGSYCWLRGRVYDHIVYEATNGRYSLYNDLTLEDLKEIMRAVKKYCATSELDDNDRERCGELVPYLELLISEVEKFPEEQKKQFRLKAWW